MIGHISGPPARTISHIRRDPAGRQNCSRGIIPEGRGRSRQGPPMRVPAHIARQGPSGRVVGPMPRRFLKKILPAPQALRERWAVRLFGDRMADPQLWTLHRRGVTYAFGAGIAICFVPLPVHLLLCVLRGAAVAAQPAGHVRRHLDIHQPLHRGAGVLHGLPGRCRAHAPAASAFPLRRRLCTGSVTASSRCGSPSSSAASPARWWADCSAGCCSRACGAGRWRPATARATARSQPEGRARASVAAFELVNAVHALRAGAGRASPPPDSWRARD